jgi:hypothetical protein
MLVENKFKNNDIISFKVSSGEEVLGRYIREDDVNFYVTKPSVLMMSQQGMGMVPYMMTVRPEEEYVIAKTSVITFARTDDDIGKQYLSKTSGIQLA